MPHSSVGAARTDQNGYDRNFGPCGNFSVGVLQSHGTNAYNLWRDRKCASEPRALTYRSAVICASWAAFFASAETSSGPILHLDGPGVLRVAFGSPTRGAEVQNGSGPSIRGRKQSPECILAGLPILQYGRVVVFDGIDN